MSDSIKTRTGRVKSAVVAVLAVFGLSALALCSTISGEPDRVVHRPRPENDAIVGWYQIDDADFIFVTHSARGGLYVADFEHYDSGSIVGDEASGFVWTTRHWDAPRHVEFQRNADGAAPQFSWSDDDGQEHAARKVDGHAYASEEVVFRNGTVALAGSLIMPRTPGPHPAAVVIHGSGTSDRDNLWYRRIIHELLGYGIAVLFPDKRGSGMSEGDWRTASFMDFAQDAVAGIELLEAREEIDRNRIGLLGISQGGWIAPLTADLDPELAFVVDISGTTLKPKEQLLHESKQTLKQRGLPGFLSAPIGHITAGVPKFRRRTWWKQNGNFDPVPYWGALDAPGLIVYGKDDEQDNVPVSRSVARIEESLPEDTSVTVKVFDNADHGLRDPETGRIRQDFLDYLANWLVEVVRIDET